MQNMKINFDYLPIDFVLEIESNTSIQQIIQPKAKSELKLARLPFNKSFKIQNIQQHTIIKLEKVKKYKITSKYDISTVLTFNLTKYCLFKPKTNKKIKLKKYDIQMTFNENKKQIKTKMPLKKYENVLIFETGKLKINIIKIAGDEREIKSCQTVKFNMNNLKEYEEVYLTLKRAYLVEEIEEDSDLLFVINGKKYIKQSLIKLFYELENYERI